MPLRQLTTGLVLATALITPLTANCAVAPQTVTTANTQAVDQPQPATQQLALAHAPKVAAQARQGSDLTLAETIDATLAEKGPYAPELGQLYASLGSQLQRQSKHEEALQVFKSAMHVERINQGLYSNSQEHILEAMIDSAVALDNWHLASDFLKHWQWLANEHGSEGPEAFLRGVRNVAKLHMRAFFGGNSLASSSAEQHILLANHWFNSAVDSLEQHYGATDEAMVPWLYDLSLSSYYLSIMSVEKNRAIEDSANNFDDDVVQASNDRAAFIMEQYRTGKESIEKIIDIHSAHPGQDIYPQVDAEILLADWYMLYNRPESAKQQYKKAYALLFDNLTYSDTEQQIVRTPVELPELGKDSEVFKEPDQSNYAIAQFDVSWRGNASNVQIVESNGASESQLNVLKQNILARKYRPQLVDGVAVDAVAFAKRYTVN